MPNKIYVLDTNVLLRAGSHALTSFEDNEVVLPFVVIEELESKRVSGESIGKYARSVLKTIDSLRRLGNINEGVPVNEDGGLLRIEVNHRKSIPHDLLPTSGRPNDIRILTVAYNLRLDEEKKGKDAREVTLITDDIPLRIYTDISLKNIKVSPYEGKQIRFTGFIEKHVQSALINGLYNKANHDIAAPKELVNAANGSHRAVFELHGDTSSHKGIAFLKGTKLHKLGDGKVALENVKPRNIEQKITLEYLFDPEIEIVSLEGCAGTGKTLMAVATGLEQVLTGLKGGREKVYNQVLVYRPMYALAGQEMGFMPGDKDEKMEPWKQAVFDSIEEVVSKDIIDTVKENETLIVEPVTFARGRTLNRKFVIIDEAQNFSKVVLAELLTRIGKNSKVVLLWDSTQRDNASVGYDEGPVEIVHQLKSFDNFAHITLKNSERSRVAKIAGGILEDYFN